MEDKKIRLSKLMSDRGICSRREADEYIAKGLVLVNGEVIDQLGTKVDLNVRITLKSEAQKQQKELVSIMLNKPIGYVSNLPEKNYEPAIRLITEDNHIDEEKKLRKSHFDGLAVAGRLDIDSQGVLIFTQDGRLAKKLIGENTVEKEYLVRIQGLVTPEKIKLLCHGLSLDNIPLKTAKVTRLNEHQLKFILNEGKKRQIRRMCELVDLQVTGLKRVRVGKLMLSSLPEGKWRFIDPSEI